MISFKNNPLFLAPMSGVNNIAFRLMCKHYGADVVYTQFLNAHALVEGRERTEHLAKVIDEERPVVIQIFGEDKNILLDAARLVEKEADVVDLNVGCPAGPIVTCGAGAGMMKNLPLLKETIQALVENCRKPISVKFRAGLSEKHIVGQEIAHICDNAGVSYITVHPRTVSQGYAGKSNWKLIKDIKDQVSIPVIGNGDIWNANDALRMKGETGCDGFMIGRAAIGNPFIFKQIKHELATGKRLLMTAQDQKDMFFTFYRLYKRHCTPLIAEIKKNALFYTKGLPDATTLRGKITELKTEEEIIDCMRLIE